MQILLSHAGQTREVDVRVQVPDATIGDLLDAAGVSAEVVTVDGRVLDPDLSLVEAGVGEGAHVRTGVHQPDLDPVEPVHHLVVVAGLTAGRRTPLTPGPLVIGRTGTPAVDLELDSPTVSARHAELSIDGDGTVHVTDLGSTNGSWVDKEPVEGTVPLRRGQQLRLGAVVLELTEPEVADQPLGLDPVRHLGPSGALPFNRPPRPGAEESAGEVALPKPPQAPGEKPLFNVIALIAPIGMAIVMVGIFRRWYWLFFAFLSPIMVIGNYVTSRRRQTRRTLGEERRFKEELATFKRKLQEARDREVALLRHRDPDLAEVRRRAQQPSIHLWARRPHHDDFLRLRVGVGEVPWHPPLARHKGDEPPEVAAVIDATSSLPRAPVEVDLTEGAVVGIVGPRAPALALARSLVLQAAVHHGPADLPVAVLADPAEVPAWAWTTWLPHTRDPDAGDGSRWLAGTPEEHAAVLARILEQRGGREDVPTLLAVYDADGLTTGRRSPGRAVLHGAAGPVAGIVIAETADQLPAVCNRVVEVQGEDGAATLQLPQERWQVREFILDGVTVDDARETARALARFEDPELQVPGGGLPARVDLVALFDDDPYDAEVVRRWWAADRGRPRLQGPLGVTEDGVFEVDLVRDGPHGLMGGTTGSGKSELLRSLVMSLALQHDPDHLTFVLIDYKGGSAFDMCADLPHTVGLVTDLDEHLGERALRCLEAELHHRERVLRDAGAPDLPSYLQLPASRQQPMPRLAVVIDEFATMKAELPDFIDALVGIAQRGRSLGVHMLLATQRPTGAVNDNIKANTNLRIALRMQDDNDSKDVIGTAQAAAISRSQPGRGYVRLGPSEVVPIQTALVTGVSGGELHRVAIAPVHFGPVPLAASAAPTSDADGPSDIERLVPVVRAAFEAEGLRPPRRPWPEPLPSRVTLEELAEMAAGADRLGRPRVALVDDPDRQLQEPIGWVPEDGSLLLVGIVGSGTTTAVASLILGLAAQRTADDLHVQVLDFGAGDLKPLESLPHVGAVVAATDLERQHRLLKHLSTELQRRKDLGAALRDEPRLVVVVDGFGAMSAEYDTVQGRGLMDEFRRLVTEGGALGVNVVLTGERAGAIPTSAAAAIPHRWLFRLADPRDYSTYGITSRKVPELPPGRFVDPATERIAHIAVPAGGLEKAVEELRRQTPQPARPPTSIRLLPGEVALAEVVDALAVDRHPWFVPVGLGERELAPAGWRLHPGDHVLVAGPPRSGKSTVLAVAAEVLLSAGIPVTVVAPRPGPLHKVDGLARLCRDHDDIDEVVPALGTAGPHVLIIDDADAFDDAKKTLERLLKDRSAPVHVLAAGRTDALRGAYSHWARKLGKSRIGLILQPEPETDGDVLASRLPKHAPARGGPGRGWLAQEGEFEFVQVAAR